MERDWYGSYSTCLTCGFVHEMLSSPPIDVPSDDDEHAGRQRRRQPSHGRLRL